MKKVGIMEKVGIMKNVGIVKKVGIMKNVFFGPKRSLSMGLTLGSASDKTVSPEFFKQQDISMKHMQVWYM